ncbi:MAG TPA: DUF2059 domain-containing protein [Longimicrobiaceae bacterium]|nr:DUF2059 domain-containing protein [Longimicrobiaceae bacterium]
MKKLLLLAVLALAARPAAAQQAPPAPSASHVQAAERLLEVSDAENALRKGMQRTMEMQAEQNPLLASMRDIMEEFYATHLGWDRMKPEMVRLYTGTFTEPELRELTAFYQTEIGRKMVERLPEIMARSAEMSQRILQEHMPELTQKVTARMQSDPELMRRAMQEAERMRQPSKTQPPAEPRSP